MKMVEIKEQPSVRCPVTKVYHIITDCKKCDAFKGTSDGLSEGEKHTFLHVKCGVDEF